MSNILTRKGLESLEKKLAEKENELKNLREEKAHAYNASGDGWHDNPGWVQLGQKEETISKEIGVLQNKISNSKIIEINPNSIDKVQLGLSVTFEQTNLLNKKVAQLNFLIATDEEANIKKNIISMNSPIGKALYGLKLNQTVQIDLPSGKFELRVLAIEFKDE